MAFSSSPFLLWSMTLLVMECPIGQSGLVSQLCHLTGLSLHPLTYLLGGVCVGMCRYSEKNMEKNKSTMCAAMKSLFHPNKTVSSVAILLICASYLNICGLLYMLQHRDRIMAYAHVYVSDEINADKSDDTSK